MDVGSGNEAAVVGSEEENLAQLEEAMNNIQNQAAQEDTEDGEPDSSVFSAANAGIQADDCAEVPGESHETAGHEPVSQESVPTLESENVHRNVAGDAIKDAEESMEVCATQGEMFPIPTEESGEVRVNQEPEVAEGDELSGQVPIEAELVGQEVTGEVTTQAEPESTGQLSAEIEDISDAEDAMPDAANATDNAPVVEAEEAPAEDLQAEEASDSVRQPEEEAAESENVHVVPTTEAISPAEIVPGIEETSSDVEPSSGKDEAIRQEEEVGFEPKDSEMEEQMVDDQETTHTAGKENMDSAEINKSVEAAGKENMDSAEINKSVEEKVTEEQGSSGDQTGAQQALHIEAGEQNEADIGAGVSEQYTEAPSSEVTRETEDEQLAAGTGTASEQGETLASGKSSDDAVVSEEREGSPSLDTPGEAVAESQDCTKADGAARPPAEDAESDSQVTTTAEEPAEEPSTAGKETSGKADRPSDVPLAPDGETADDSVTAVAADTTPAQPDVPTAEAGAGEEPMDTDAKEEEPAIDATESVKVAVDEKTLKPEVKSDEDMKHEIIRQESKSPDDMLKSDGKGKSKAEGTKEEKKSAKHQQVCIVCRRVGKCKYNIVRNGDIKHLCDDLCFKRFRANPTSFLGRKAGEGESEDAGNCAQCKAALVPGKCVQVDGKQFCSANCSKTSKETKNSKDAEDDIEIVGTSKVTATPKTRQSAPSPAVGKGTTGKCSVCSQQKAVKHEVNFAKKMHRLCSDSCFAAFRYANKLSMANCDSCGKPVNSENLSNTVQFEGALRKFCTAVCMNTYKTKKQKIVACTWCQAKKSNFDMVERVDGNKVQLFCSLNCLSLYRVNLQATSNQKVTCDHCTKFAPAQYHLTMSDASVRNFCSYNCVMGFQAQFQQPQTPSAGAGRGTQAPAGVAGRGTPQIGRGTPGVGRGGAQLAQPNTPTTPAQPAGRGRSRQTRQSQRGKGATTPATTPATVGTLTPNSMPLISQVISLAESGASPVTNQKGKTPIPTTVTAMTPSGGGSTAPAPPPPPQQATVSTQIIVQPPQPKPMRNKMLLCKPVTQTKATSCRPHAITEGTQTEPPPNQRSKGVLCKPILQTKATSCRPLVVTSSTQTLEEDFVAKPALIPVPVPIYIPVPMAMYNIPVPYPVPVPLPIPVPCFVPTTRKSAEGILKQIKKIRDTVPDDPFEAELLMMAEAVAGQKEESSSSEDEAVDDGHDDAVEQEPAEGGGPAPETYGEDMLQMALRMASEMPDEPAMDLESQLQATPVNPAAPALPQAYSALDGGQMAPEPLVHRQKSRPKRRSSSRTPRAKKPKMEEQPPEPVPEPINIQPQEPPADANMVLKFTYGVNAWKHWVIGKNQLLEKQHTSARGSKPKLYKTDVLACTPDELNFALCQFVKEVRKPNGEEYAPDSIYYLTLGIQEYLFENGRIDNIFTDIYYERFTECLNEVLSHYEVRLNQQGLIVCRIEEEHLWESKQLGAHSPHVLLNTLVYFNTKHFMLRSVEEHLRLSFSHIMKHWKKTSVPGSKNAGRSVYLRYYAPVHNSDGARSKRREDQPVFEQAENLENPLRCPVKLYEFYLSKCPESIKNRNDVFYLIPERSCVPDSPVWYSTNNLGADHMSKMLNRLRVVKEIQEAQLHMQPYMGATGY